MDGEIETISLIVQRHLVDEMNAAVDRGEFASPSELVAFALAEWKARREETEELRRLCNEGIASGPGRRMSLEEIKTEGLRRLARG